MTTRNPILAATFAALLAACAGTSKSSTQTASSEVPQKANTGTADQQNPQGPAGAQVEAGPHGHAHGGHAMGGHGHGMEGHGTKAGAMAGMCPMAVEGTKVAASDTPDGAALTFTTEGDVEELRRRVRAAAAHHTRMAEAHAGAGMGAGVGMGTAAGDASAGAGASASPSDAGTGAGCCGGGHGGGMALMSASARAEEVPQGARLVLVPKDAAQAASLRAEVREHATQMASGRCPMTMGG